MTDFMDKIFKGSKKLTQDAGNNAPKKKSVFGGFGKLFGEVKETNHDWCSAPVLGADKCTCTKHKPKNVEVEVSAEKILSKQDKKGSD